ncbi:uncharacterized protein [Nicotiana sylvestris]|uniref:uncharacterized protein n=1 Tax=Nicotiana sylvestris TaxID=4096 RepID=UPI00388CA7AB
MRDHIIGEYYELWDIVTDGPLATTKKNAKGVDMPKTRADCTDEDLKKWEKNAKAKKWLVCGLGPDESEGETIQEMYTRFTTLINELKSIGRIIPEEDKVEKILTRVLPVSWESKITAIQELKNIATLKLDELIGNFTAYELRRQTIKMDAPKKERSLTLRIAEERLSELLLDFIDESEIINNEKEDLCRECMILKSKCKNLESRANKSESENAELKNQVLELDTSILELRSDNLKLKLGIGKKKAAHTHLTLEENLRKIKDELYRKDEQIRVLKEDIGKGSSQIWYMDIGCLKHMTKSKNRFLSLEDLKGGNVSFGNGKKDHHFSAPRIPQQNGVVERKNMTLEDMARTMLPSSKLPHNFWSKVIVKRKA